MFHGAVLLAIGMGLGRLLGLVRDYLIVSLLGVGESSDFFIMLATLPDTLMFLVGGSVFASVVVPWYRTGPEIDAVNNWTDGIGTVINISVLVSIVLAVFHESFSRLLIPSLSDQLLDQFSGYVVTVMLLFPVIIITQFRTCFLQARLQFSRMSLSTPVFNVTFIAVTGCSIALIVVVERALLVAILAAVIVRAAFMIYGTQIRFGKTERVELLHRTGFDFGYYGLAAVVGAGLVLLPIVARSIESSRGDGAATYFHLGWRLYEFALGLVCYSIANSLIPRLKNDGVSQRQAGTSISLILVLLTSVAIGAYISSAWLGSTLKLLIAANDMDADMLAAVIRAYAPSVVFYGVIIFVSTVLIAQRKATALLLSIVFGLIFLVSLVAMDGAPPVVFGASTCFMCGIQLYTFTRHFWVNIVDLGCLIVGLCLTSAMWIAAYHLNFIEVSGWTSIVLGVFAGLSVLMVAPLLSSNIRKMGSDYLGGC